MIAFNIQVCIFFFFFFVCHHLVCFLPGAAVKFQGWNVLTVAVTFIYSIPRLM